MNQKQSIFNLLAKKPATKLSASRKVKLSLIDDLGSVVNQAQNSSSTFFGRLREMSDIYEQIDGLFQILYTLQEDMDSDNQSNEIILERITELTEQARDAAGALGIAPQEIEGFQNAENTIENYNNIINRSNNVSSIIDSISWNQKNPFPTFL